MGKGIVVLGSVFVDIKGYPISNYIPGSGRNAGRVEQVHGGVCRNVVEDIANVELRPTFLSIVDHSGTGEDVIRRLKRHKVNTDYMLRTEDGMGTWLAVFGNNGDVVASISKRPDLTPIYHLLKEKGDEIVSDCDALALEIDMEKDTVKLVFALAEKYHKPVFAVVSNMSIAMKRRDFLKRTSCFVCNLEEAGLFFGDHFAGKTPAQMVEILGQYVPGAHIPMMVVTMGGEGAVYADQWGNKGYCPAKKVDVIDTTGAGDSFFSGVVIGLTYGKTLAESCEIGSRLAASVIATRENVCPRFMPQEFGLNVPVEK